MKNILTTLILSSIILLSFSEGSFHSDMNMELNKHPYDCHSKIKDTTKNDTCDYICSLILFHSNEISPNILSFHSINIILSDNFETFNTLKPFKPPIYIF